jgi:acetyl-CoA synthetase
MTWTPIIKARNDAIAPPNLQDYEQVRRAFSWKSARDQLSGLPQGRGLNIAYEAVDRHALGPRREHVAIRWLGKHGESHDLSYATLSDLSNRFANLLRELGVPAGERVFALTGRVPELYVAALGTLKCRCVFCPLFSAFGPEPIRARMTIGQARVLVTTEAL